MYSANRQAYEAYNSTLKLSLIRCHWLFHQIFNTGINPGIPGLQNFYPEIPGLGSAPGIANSMYTPPHLTCAIVRSQTGMEIGPTCETCQAASPALLLNP